MADIFLSYSSKDRERIGPLINLLEQAGYSVFWDRTIPPGKIFDQVIEEAIDTAKCVIVVWSKNSVVSDWVRNEAEEGARRQILVPVQIDDVRIPLAFRRVQAVRLLDWDDNSAEFKLLVKTLKGLVEPVINEDQLSSFHRPVYRTDGSPKERAAGPLSAAPQKRSAKTEEAIPQAAAPGPTTPTSAPKLKPRIPSAKPPRTPIGLPASLGQSGSFWRQHKAKIISAGVAWGIVAIHYVCLKMFFHPDPGRIEFDGGSLSSLVPMYLFSVAFSVSILPAASFIPKMRSSQIPARAMSLVGILMCLFWVIMALLIWTRVVNYRLADPGEISQFSWAILGGAIIVAVGYGIILNSRQKA